MSWTEKGASLSDKNARKEYGISQEEIIEGIHAGKLQYQRQSAHGNPYLKLLREEVEQLVKEKHGPNYLEEMGLTTRLKKVISEQRSLKRKINLLAKEQKVLEAKLVDLGEG